MKKINNPFPKTIKKNKVYFWCACGKSANHPLCEGSHKNTKKSPIKFERNRTVKIGRSNEREDYSAFSIGERILIFS